MHESNKDLILDQFCHLRWSFRPYQRVQVDVLGQSMALTPLTYLNDLLGHFSLHGFHFSVVMVGKSIFLQIQQEFIIYLKRIKMNRAYTQSYYLSGYVISVKQAGNSNYQLYCMWGRNFLHLNLPKSFSKSVHGTFSYLLIMLLLHSNWFPVHKRYRYLKYLSCFFNIAA